MCTMGSVKVIIVNIASARLQLVYTCDGELQSIALDAKVYILRKKKIEGREEQILEVWI